MTGPDRPAVSVVLCVRNGGALLDEQLAALGRQRLHIDWELVVVDNGSTDDSMQRVKRSAHLFPALTIEPATEMAGLSYARNVGARCARGEVLAYCDADDIVEPDWLANLYAAARPGRIAGGALRYETLNTDEVRFWRGVGIRMDRLPIGFDYLPHVMGANFAITKADLTALGGFDEIFVGSSDEVDLCFRAQQQGMEVVFAENATVNYRLRESIRDTARQQVAYGRSAVLLHRKHRGSMPTPTARQAITPYWSLLIRIHQLGRGHRMRGYWICHAAYRWGRIVGSIHDRSWFI